jgi:hypothetical protein
MPTHSKTRMVSFRLTVEEYEHIRHLCFARGISSISEMARDALAWMVQQEPESYGSIEARVAKAEKRIDVLTCEVKQLKEKTAAAVAVSR